MNFVKQVNQALAAKFTPAFPKTLLLEDISNLETEIPLVSTKGFNPHGGKVMLGIFHYASLDAIDGLYPSFPASVQPPTTNPKSWGKQPGQKTKRVLNETFDYTSIVENMLVGVSRGAFGGGYTTPHFAGETVIGIDPYYKEPEEIKKEEAKENLEDWLKAFKKL